MRSQILEAQKAPLPESLNIKDIAKEKVQVPDIVKKLFNNFIRALIFGGQNQQVKLANAIFTVTSGLQKTSKHLQLGMNIKSLIGSTKVVDFLKRLGHSVSYITTEELETEIIFGAAKEKILTSNGMSLNPDNSIRVASDTFDRCVETVTGKYTLHNTVGIAYENSSSATEEDVYFQVEDDQEVEVCTHINKENLVLTSDGCQN